MFGNFWATKGSTELAGVTFKSLERKKESKKNKNKEKVKKKKIKHSFEKQLIRWLEKSNNIVSKEKRQTVKMNLVHITEKDQIFLKSSYKIKIRTNHTKDTDKKDINLHFTE